MQKFGSPGARTLDRRSESSNSGTSPICRAQLVALSDRLGPIDGMALGVQSKIDWDTLVLRVISGGISGGRTGIAPLGSAPLPSAMLWHCWRVHWIGHIRRTPMKKLIASIERLSNGVISTGMNRPGI